MRISWALRSCALAMTLSMALPAAAEESPWRGGGALLFEGWSQEEAPEGHGALVLEVRHESPESGHRWQLQLNTDTLDGLRRWRTRFGAVEVGVRGQVGFANLLPDYIVDGQRDPARGVWASYAEGRVAVEAHPGGGHWMRGTLRARQWVHAAMEETDPELVLPPSNLHGVAGVGWGWWRLDGDAAFEDGWVWRPRVRGVALALEAELIVQGEPDEWGLASPDPAGATRNLATGWDARLQQDLRFGIRGPAGLRLQVHQQAGWTGRMDDRWRLPVGGMAPWGVPLAGLPWAAWMSDGHAAAQVSLHAWAGRAVEAGLFADGAVLRDPRRSGLWRDVGGAVGGGAFVDGRTGRAVWDLRAGVSPVTPWPQATLPWALWAGVGWGL